MKYVLIILGIGVVAYVGFGIFAAYEVNKIANSGGLASDPVRPTTLGDVNLSGSAFSSRTPSTSSIL